MTTLSLLMGFVAFAVAGLGLGLWQMVRLSRQGRRVAPPEPARAVPLHSYGPMARLFDGRDLQFLKCQPGCRPGMTSRLRLQRRAVLSLYLSQARADFRQCWASWLSVARGSDSPGFALAAVKQLLVFYGLYFALQAHCLLGLFVYVRTDVGGLMRALQGLQESARQSVGHRPSRRHALPVR